jgi:hypothetical protein
MILNIIFEENKLKQSKVIPCKIENYTPSQITDASQIDRFFNKLETISLNVTISNAGLIIKR